MIYMNTSTFFFRRGMIAYDRTLSLSQSSMKEGLMYKQLVWLGLFPAEFLSFVHRHLPELVSPGEQLLLSHCSSFAILLTFDEKTDKKSMTRGKGVKL